LLNEVYIREQTGIVILGQQYQSLIMTNCCSIRSLESHCKFCMSDYGLLQQIWYGSYVLCRRI